MSTTTLRLPDDVKARIDKLAAAKGKSAHAFMLDTLAETTESMERRLAFEAEAEERWAEYRRTGEYVALEDMRAYARARAAGLKPARPKVEKGLPAMSAARRK
jgi:predicted transcriptional regulator